MLIQSQSSIRTAVGEELPNMLKTVYHELF
jgi:hypothetical protein